MIQFDTPEDPTEARLTLKALRLALGATPKFKGPPDIKRMQRWLALPQPMPSKLIPGGHREYLLSHVLAWLDDPQAYYGRKRRAS